MAKLKTFPHYQVEVKDESLQQVFVPEDSPLHRPIFFGFAEKGPVGVPSFGDYTALSKLYGKGTFDEYSKFFYHPNLFLKTALNYQKCFFVRIADATAAKASAVLEAHVKEGVQITQYEKDEFGGRALDASGNPIPKMEGGIEVKEPGIEITWALRALTEDETPDNLLPAEVDGVNIFPILVMTPDSPGAWANKAGVKIWFDWSTADTSVINTIDALMFNMGIVSQEYGMDIPTPVRNFYNNPTTEFSFNPEAIDTSTDRRVYFDHILNNDFASVPFNMKVFPENVEAIGQKVMAAEPMMIDITNPYMVDIMTATDLEGHPYDHLQIKTDGVDNVTVMDENVIQYMQGGSDGDTSVETLNSLTDVWLSGDVFPDIYDQARYPITHIYDSGYPLETKKNIIDFLGIRDDVKVVVGTQDVFNEKNTKEEDQSTGSALRSQLLLHPESTIYGTQACRGTIFQQCGKLISNPNWLQIVPATYDCLIKKCFWQGAVYFKGKPKGLPNSAVTTLKDINWFPNSDDHKQLSWDTGLNYMQYYDMTGYHYPDVKSIYPYDSSLISDDILCDMLVYLKHVARLQWATFAGRDESPELLFGEIRESISDDIYTKFGVFLKTEVSVYQTDVDKALGYQTTIEIAVYGNFSQRVWNVLIPVRRNEGE
jgi:hypothetical protein